jgi:hypothetical protein
MVRTHNAIVAELNSFAPPNDDWDQLQSILDELWKNGVPTNAMPDLLALFERYPVDEDGCGVFWSALHGLESLPGYETHLLQSVENTPSEFGVMMLGRMLNAHMDKIDGKSIVSALAAVADSAAAPDRVRKLAAKYAALR